MEKTEYELARQAQEDSRSRPASPIDDDVILSTAVQSNVDLTTRGVRRAALPSHRGGPGRLPARRGRQTLRGDTLIVRRETGMR
jgi:hypothetical protein